MIDIRLIREKPEIVKKDLDRRKATDKISWIEIIQEKDKQARSLKKDVDELRYERNTLSQEINQAKKIGKDATKIIEKAKKIPTLIESKEKKLEKLSKEIKKYLMGIPNILHESVPQGDSDEDNEVVHGFGKKPEFDFKPKSHVDLLEELDLADIERAAKISGSRFWFLKNELVQLDLALQKYALDFMQSKGYTLMQPPFMIRHDPYEGVTDLSDFEDVMYKIEGEDLYLIATSEHPLVSMHQDETLNLSKGPMKIAGISSCFRKEAGTHGKDTKGIFRGHQFNKVEQIIFCKPEDSWKLHEEITKNAIEFFESLELHFRQVNVCTGDIGTVAAKKYDLEVWYPVQNAYREITSASNVTDYQTRRLNIRYQAGNKHELAHTLNNTCVATARTMAAILENFQTKEGTVKIPKVLWPYMNGTKEIKPKQK